MQDQPEKRPDKEIFFEASEIEDAQERAGFLRGACDAGQRARVGELLALHFKQDAFMGAPAGEMPPEISRAHELPEEPGGRIGRYKILEKLGEGGFGVVYVAEQKEPVRRRVALKVIKLGMDTRQVVARFEAERQALALMEHPNIAKALDAGATEAGRPYFVMELVRGVRITQHCDENHLGARERLKLCVLVCHAIEHAHQKGIIHRDIKPSNILVTQHDGVATPKVIDFGIAKATGGDLTDKTIYTQLHHFIGTPAYISPEQAAMSGQDVDTRTDIYALGVLLYELLTGATPFDAAELQELGLDKMRQTIREKEPARPSTRLTQELAADRTRKRSSAGQLSIPTQEEVTAAARREARLKEQVRLLRGDLDWIVMKCLEKDRARRYATASALAADIARHLNNEPVSARPPSAAYRLQKFARRNKAGVAVGASLLLGLLAALIVGGISFRRERAARQVAEGESLRARQYQYAADMNLAHAAVSKGNVFRALKILERHRPTNSLSAGIGSAPVDLRNWEWRYLWKEAQGKPSQLLATHTNGVTAAGFFPDGRSAFTGGKDSILRVWDIDSRRLKSQFEHPHQITGALVSPDGRWLAVSTEASTNSIHLWDLRTGQLSHTVPGNIWVRPNSLAFSPDSQMLALGTILSGVMVWSVAEKKPVAQLPSYHTWLGPVGIAFSPLGNILACGENAAGDIALWDMKEGKVTHRLKGHQWYVTGLAFTPDGRSLISGSGDYTVNIWDVAAGSLKDTFKDYDVAPGALDVASVRVSPDGKMFATAAQGGGMSIAVQDTATGEKQFTFVGHQHLVGDLAFSPDGRFCLSASLDGSARLWDLSVNASDPDVQRMPEGLGSLVTGSNPSFSLSPDGMHMLTVFSNRTFTVWETNPLRQGASYASPVEAPAALAIARGGKLAAFVTTDGDIIFWHGDSNQTNWFARPSTNPATRAVFSADGKLLAVGGAKELSVCDVERGVTLHKSVTSGATNHYAAHSLEFSPDGKQLAIGHGSGFLRALDFRGETVEQITMHEQRFQVAGFAFLPGGKTAISLAEDIRFFELATGRTTEIFKPRAAMYRRAAISQDSKRLAVGGADGLITIWDLASGQEVGTFAGLKRPLIGLSFLPDGDTLLSVSVEQIRLWRAAPFKESDALTASARP